MVVQSTTKSEPCRFQYNSQ